MTKKCEERLKDMMLIDNSNTPSKMERVIKAEVYYVLKNYLEIVGDSLDIDIELMDNGLYKLKMECVSKSIKGVKCL